MLNRTLGLDRTPRPNILICDDDLDYSRELIEALEAHGFRATNLMTITASRASVLAPSILILDVCMPERSGIDIIRILAEHPRRAHFKIVLVSGCSETIIASVTRQIKASGVQFLGSFQKPVDVRQLCELLKVASIDMTKDVA